MIGSPTCHPHCSSSPSTCRHCLPFLVGWRSEGVLQQPMGGRRREEEIQGVRLRTALRLRNLEISVPVLRRGSLFPHGSCVSSYEVRQVALWSRLRALQDAPAAAVPAWGEGRGAGGGGEQPHSEYGLPPRFPGEAPLGCLLWRLWG